MDTKKVLLGSTAIVGAGMLLANPSPAQAQIEVVLSGYTEFGAVWAEDEAITQGTGDQGYDFFMDNEVFIRAEGTDDATGIVYGSLLELEVGTGTEGGETVTDEISFFAAGAFGRVELGRDDGAEDVMMLGAESVAAGTGGIDGDLPINLTGGNILDSGDAEKVTYFTPRVGGFQAGVTYSPDTGEDPEDVVVFEPAEAVANVDDFVGVGLNFVGEFAGLDVGIAAVGSFGDETPVGAGLNNDFGPNYAVGGTVGFAGLNFGASYGHQEVGDFENEFITGGVAFGLGPANMSFTYEYNEPDIDIDFDDDDDILDDNAHLFVLSADVGLVPGVILKSDFGYVTDDFGTGTLDQIVDDDDDEDDPDLVNDTLAAVVTLQINY